MTGQRPVPVRKSADLTTGAIASGFLLPFLCGSVLVLVPFCEENTEESPEIHAASSSIESFHAATPEDWSTNDLPAKAAQRPALLHPAPVRHHTTGPLPECFLPAGTTRPDRSAGAPRLRSRVDTAQQLRPACPIAHLQLAGQRAIQAVNVPFLTLLSDAFALPETQILNAPAWLRTEKFDLEARADPSLDAYMRQLPPASARLEKQKMLQALFADRFQLAARPETRELPLFVLVAAKTGATLLPSKASGTTIDTHRGQFIATGVPLSSLAEALARETGRVVLDQTGITGRYDITRTWVPTDDTSPPADSSGPFLFTAIQEQLGLKLEGRKGPVPVLVIDRVDHPSAN